jgi:hypothetical protein
MRTARARRAVAEARADLVRQHATEIGMIEDRFGERAAKHRIACQSRMGLVLDQLPELTTGCV